MTNIAMKNFFIIDSEHLDNVATHFYGFSINEDMIINSNMADVNDFVPDREQCGSWVYVERTNDEIVINQDYQGTFGLYLFQAENYFAISNSFIMLVDFIKAKYQLSLNVDHIKDMMCPTLCSFSFSTTPVNEIRVLSRFEKIHINVNKRTLQIEIMKNNDLSIAIDSIEGIKILDAWFEKWIVIINKLVHTTNNIVVDLTGGMDTRIIFNLFLLARIDLSKLCIRFFSLSTQDTVDDDKKISSIIAAQHNLTLNNGHLFTNIVHLPQNDVVNNSFYVKLGFDKYMSLKSMYSTQPIYSFTGLGGECLKSFTPMYAPAWIPELEKLYSKEILHKYLSGCIYRETRDRWHHGKGCVETFLNNIIYVSPLMDPMLRKLTISSRMCIDNNLLYAIIYTRYMPTALDLPFDSGHDIAESTISFAKTLNKYIPHQLTNKKSVQPYIIKGCSSKQHNDINYSDNMQHCIVSANNYVYELYKSSSIRNAFTQVFPLEMYINAEQDLQQIIMILTVAKLIQSGVSVNKTKI